MTSGFHVDFLGGRVYDGGRMGKSAIARAYFFLMMGLAIGTGPVGLGRETVG